MVEFFVGLAYSNIQNNHDIPTFVAGVLLSANRLSAIQGVHQGQKDEIIGHRSSLEELQQEYDQLQTYLDASVIIRKTNVRGDADAISEMYVEAVKSLLGVNLPLIHENRVITYRKIVAMPGFSSEDISKTANSLLLSLAQNVKEKQDFDSDTPMQIARLLARLEYERSRVSNFEFLIQSVKKAPQRHFQFYKMSYPTVFVEDYVDNFVGIPEVLVRDLRRGVCRLPIKIWNTIVDIQPTVKFCRGTREDGWIKPCQASSDQQPFGNAVLDPREEKCSLCKNKERYVECLSRKPLCDGIKVTCRNRYFAGDICNGEFGLYITRFGDSLKVGEAFLPNLVSRLLEQGASSALLLYPISNIERAYKLEHLLKKYLENHIGAIGDGITHVRLGSPKTKAKISYFLENWETADTSLIHQLIEVVESCELRLGEDKISLSSVEKKVCNFLANYQAPPNLIDISLARPAERVKGTVVGYRGSVIFLDTKKVVDLKRLQGRVLRGRIRCPAR